MTADYSVKPHVRVCVCVQEFIQEYGEVRFSFPRVMQCERCEECFQNVK